MWAIVLVAGLAILAAAIPLTRKSFPDPIEYDRERLEKTCDAVTSLLSILIPGSLLAISWAFDKFHDKGYGAWLFIGLGWLFVVLIFTLYMRFNYVWGFKDAKFKMGGTQGLAVLSWLPTVIVGLTFGLVCLAMPILRIAWKMPATTPALPLDVHVECHVDMPTPAPTPIATASHGNQRHDKKNKKQKRNP
jgi:hypothetical protein